MLVLEKWVAVLAWEVARVRGQVWVEEACDADGPQARRGRRLSQR